MKTILLTAVALSALAACRGQTSHEEPIVGIRNMYDQPKYDVQEESQFEGFADHRTMRPLPEGVVASNQEVNPEVATGRVEDQSAYVMTVPNAVIQRFGSADNMLARGKERYGVYCTPCHDNTGGGEGLVKRRAVAGGAAAFVPPTFHQDRLRHAPDGQIFGTISNGKGNMPPYAAQVRVDDRWAIVSYVRALQIAAPKMAAPAVAPTSIQGGATAAPPPGGVPGAGGSAQVPPSPSGSAATASPPGSGAPSGSATGATNATRPMQSVPVISPPPSPGGSAAPSEKKP